MGKSFLFSVGAILLVALFCQAADMSAEKIMASVEYQQMNFLESVGVNTAAGCFLNPACFGQEVVDKSAGVFSLNGAGTISAIHKEGAGDTLFLATCHHYTPDLQEGDVIDMMLLPDHQSLACEDQAPLYDKKIYVIAKAVSVSSWLAADQVIYKVLYMYGNENFIQKIIDYGFVLKGDLPAGYPGTIFGCPRDGNMNLKRVSFGEVNLFNNRAYKIAVGSQNGTFAFGSSGSFFLDQSLRAHGLIFTMDAGDCISKPTIGVFSRLSFNYEKLRNFFGADSAMPRFRNLAVKKVWPIAAWFESVKVQTDYNHIKLVWKTGWQRPDTTRFEIEVAYNGYSYYKVASIIGDKAGVYTWQDTLDFNATAKYRIKAVNDWRYNTSDVVQTDVRVVVETNITTNNCQPAGYSLFQNYPNPFNPSTIISYQLATAEQVKLIVYDMLGRVVRTLIAGEFKSGGEYAVRWDGRDDYGKQVAAGVYLCKIQAGDFTDTRRMVFAK